MLDPRPPSLDRFQEIVGLISQQPSRRPIPTELEKLLQRYYMALTGGPADPTEVQQSVGGLLVFLMSSGGGCPENYRLVGDFVLTENEWEMDWSYLPGALEDLLFDLSSALSRIGSSDPPETPAPSALPNELLRRAQNLRV